MSRSEMARADCPVCDSSNTRVISCKKALQGELVVVRRRCCNDCGFRYWTGQARETLLADIKWTRNGRSSAILEAFPEVD